MKMKKFAIIWFEKAKVLRAQKKKDITWLNSVYKKIREVSNIKAKIIQQQIKKIKAGN